MLLCIVYAMFFVDTVDTGVCVMRCENSTLLCIQWPQICRHCGYKTHSHISVRNFLNIQLIFNPQKVLES